MITSVDLLKIKVDILSSEYCLKELSGSKEEHGSPGCVLRLCAERRHGADGRQHVFGDTSGLRVRLSLLGSSFYGHLEYKNINNKISTTRHIVTRTCVYNAHDATIRTSQYYVIK